ncbi:MAG: T9SS type A sorting domain-containing protein [Chitinophagales bacterium]|nr:T9SS type A sorting domain-containing protein [Chitinophagales bacterium]
MKKILVGIFILTICFQNAVSQNNNNSLHFATDDYVALNKIAQDVNNLSEFTIEFWVKFNAQLNTDYNTFYAVNTSDYGNRFLIRCAGPIDNVSDAVVVYINDGSNQYMVGTTPIGDNKCHHIAFTYNNGICLLYLDGELEASANYIIGFQNMDLHSLGQEYDMAPIPTSAFYHGELDDFRIWNIAKSQADIDNHKDIELVGNETGLLAYFNFNQGTPSGYNTTISNLNNLAQPSNNGLLVDFDLNGSSTSNFITSACANTMVNTAEHDLFNQIDIYPNPTSNFLNLTNAENILSITIRNHLGQIVLKPEPDLLIDISTLSASSYFIDILTSNNRRQIFKFLKL